MFPLYVAFSLSLSLSLFFFFHLRDILSFMNVYIYLPISSFTRSLGFLLHTPAPFQFLHCIFSPILPLLPPLSLSFLRPRGTIWIYRGMAADECPCLSTLRRCGHEEVSVYSCMVHIVSFVHTFHTLLPPFF
ncbi:hypothetical protein F4775DRAFT_533953 [Biscogniauxia sp. FL1348]|nr:hypothetical protein F4775DRAFT_533953 [Biscogniauxia sp. FL1348]